MGAVNVTGFPLEWNATINTDNFDKELQSLNQKIGQSMKGQAREQDLINAAQKEYARLIIQSGQAFAKLDSGIQSQIKQLGSLQDEIEKVRAAKDLLQGKRDLGIVGEETFSNSMAALVNREKELSQAVEKLSQDMRTNDAIMKAASGSIVQKTLELEALKRKYIELSETDRVDISVGGNILNQIQGLDAELSQLSQNFKTVQQNAAGSINEKVALLSKLKNEYSALSEVDRNSDIGKGMLQNIQKVDDEVRVLNQSFQSLQQNAVGSLNAKIAELQRLKSEYASLSEVDRNGSVGKNLASNIKGLDKEVAKINSEFEKTNSLAQKAALAIGAYLSLSAGTNFIKDIVRVRGEFQQLEVAFTTMLGSKEKADRLMEEVTQFAATTPFELSDIATATKQLLAFGISADKIKGTLRSLGDISAGVGAPIQEIAEIYGKARVQGRLFAEDINQLTGRGIPIISELAKQFGVTEDKVKDLVESGKVGFPQVEQAFNDLTAAGSKFGGLMEKQSQTLTGKLSNLSDAWSQMLNEIGKSGEGVFSDAIGGATSLVKNYQTVLDILKELLLMYTSYKVAVAATIALKKVDAAITGEITIAERLRTIATLGSQRAMALLNATILANPMAFFVAGISALVGAFVLLGKETIKVKSTQELLSDAQEKVGDRFAETKAKIQPYVDALKNANLSEEERLKIYNKLKEIDPKIVEGLDAKKLSYQTLTEKVNGYLTALRNQIKLETNKEAVTSSVKQEEAFQKDIELLEKKKANAEAAAEAAKKRGDKEAAGIAQFTVSEANTNIKVLKKQLEEQQKVTQEIGGKVVETEKKQEGEKLEAKKRTLAVIDEEIKKKKEEQQANATNAAEYKKYQDQIKALEEERKKIAGATKSELRSQQTEENQINKVLEKRKDILQTIEDLKRDADQSGLIKEQSELDKINEKYDTALRKIQEFNESKDVKEGKVQAIGLVAINDLNQARDTQISNTIQKQQAEEFKKSIEDQKSLFEQFEDYKKNLGIEKAGEMFREQTKGFTSYIEMLKSQLDALKNDTSIGGQIKFKFITETLATAEKDKIKRDLEEQAKSFQEVLQITSTYNQQREDLDRKYFKLRESLEQSSTTMTKEEYKKRTDALNQAKQEEIEALNNDAARQTDLFKLLGKDLILATASGLKEHIGKLKKILKDGFTLDKDGNKVFLTPEMKAAIGAAVDQIETLLASTNETAVKMGKVAKSLGDVKKALSAAATLAGQFDEGLQEALETMTSMVDAGIDIATAVGQFASGDILGGIASGISGVTKLVGSLFGESPAEKKRKEDLKNLQTSIYTGEFEINELYRERARLALEAYTITLQRIAKEKELLQQQKGQIQTDFETVLKELQGQTAQALGKQITPTIMGQDFLDEFTQKLLDAGMTLEQIREKFKDLPDAIVNISLQGMDFEQLEQLFIKGQLQGKAKELFEQLQKLKSEGLDVDKALEDAKRKAQELFTGTTADSITDAIVSGFENGLKSGQDFAQTFEGFMRKAMLNTFKFKYLEAPLQKFFEEFAAASESNGELTSSEVDELNNKFDSIINAANVQFDQLQKISGLDFSKLNEANNNSLSGGIKTIQEETAQVLAGRIGAMQLTALDQLNIAKQSLDVHLKIESNTAKMVAELVNFKNTFISVATVEGIKLK